MRLLMTLLCLAASLAHAAPPKAEAFAPLFELAGIRLLSSCRNGTCRTCRCQVISGRARHLIEWPGLSEEERLDGAILPCVATAESALRIDAPRAFQLREPGPARPDVT